MAPIGRKIAALFAVPVAIVLLGQPMLAAASDEEGGSGSGTFAELSFVGVPIVTTTADGTTLIAQSTTGVFTGTISGPFTEVLVAAVFADGTQTFSGYDTCVCSVGGISGSFADKFQGSGIVPNFTGTLTVIRGTGGLSKLHATSKFTGAVAATGLASGQYSIQYRFHSDS